LYLTYIRSEIEGDVASTSGQHDTALEGNSLDSWSHCIKGKGQTFNNAEEFRIKIKNYAIATRRSFFIPKK